MKKEYVVLVDKHDNPIGQCEKLEAHRDDRLHRAFSVLLVRGQDVLLQQRHPDKYHSGGLWANTCCSHPRPDEDIISAGKRRLHEEMGITAALTDIGSFIYQTQLTDTLSEHEYDHILIGTFDSADIPFNKNEVIATKWMAISQLKQELETNPTLYVVWLKQVLDIYLQSR